MRLAGFVFLTFFLLPRFANAQFYFDFEESGSFYNRSLYLRTAGYTTENVIVKQVKNKVLEDSFQVVRTTYNADGNPVSISTGSKWNAITLSDSFQYNAGGKQQHLSFKKTIPSTGRTFVNNYPSEYDGQDTLRKGGFRYEFDSVKKVKKVFYKQGAYKETLLRLVFFNEEGKVSKVDYQPESEKVYYNEYEYRKNKLKIFTVSSYGRTCNERMYFNDEGQLVKREVDFKRSGQWFSNVYEFTYTPGKLLATEKKIAEGKFSTEVVHQYE